MRVDKPEPAEPHISESEPASQVETTEEDRAETAVKHNQDRKIDIIESMVAVDKSNLNMNQVYQQRLDKFIAEPCEMDSTPSSQTKRQHEASSSSENESETEHELDICQRKLKLEMDKNENEHEALSDIETAAADDDDDDLDDNEEVHSHVPKPKLTNKSTFIKNSLPRLNHKSKFFYNLFFCCCCIVA